MTARISKRLGLPVAACLVIAAVAVALWRSRWPAYEGQSLPIWFEQLPLVTVNDPHATIVYKAVIYSGSRGASRPGGRDGRKALTAIRAIGTNGLPFLIEKLERRPPRSRFAKLAQRYAGGLPLTQTLFPSVLQTDMERGQAVTGLLALCPLPLDAVEKLRALSLDFNGPAWSVAGDVLRANGNPKILQDALKPYE